MKNKKNRSILSLLLAISILLSSFSSPIAAFGAKDTSKKASTKSYIEYPEGSTDNPRYPDEGSVGLDKNAKWIDKDSSIAEVKMEVEGIPIQDGTDIVLVVDESGSMQQEGRLKFSREATEEFIKKIYEDNANKEPSNNRISFLVLGDRTEEAIPGSGFADVSKKDQLIQRAKDLRAYSGTNPFSTVFEEAFKMIESRTGTDRDRPVQMLFMTDGVNDSGERPYDHRVKAVKDLGVKIHSVGYRLTKEEFIAPLRDLIASTPNDFYNATALADLSGAFTNIADNSQIAGKNSQIIEKIGPDFEIITSHPSLPQVKAPSTGGAGEGTISTSGKTITWDRGDVTKKKGTMTYYLKIKNVPVQREYPITETAGSYINYTNYLGNKVKKNFRDLLLPYPGGQIRIVKYLVNDEGKALGDINGTSIVDDDKIGLYAYKIKDALYESSGSSFLQFGDYPVSYEDYDTKDGFTFQRHPKFAGNETVSVTTSDNMITRYVGYTKAKDVNYKVTHNYKDEKGNVVISNETNDSDTIGNTVTAKEESIPGYKFEKATPSKSIVLDTEASKNTIIMEYVIDNTYTGDSYKGSVNYYLNGTTNKVPGITENPKTFKGYPGQEFDINHPTLLGYNVLSSQPTKLKLSYKPDTPVNETVYYDIDKNSKDFSGKIKYKLKGTNDDVPGLIGDNPKVVNGYPGEVISVDNPDAPGYKVLGGANKANIELSKDPNDPHSAEITVYYEYNSASRDFKGEISYFLKDTKNPVTDLETVLSGYNSTTGILSVSGSRGASLSIGKPKVPTQGYKPVDSSSELIVLPTTLTDIAKKTIFYEIDKDQKFEYKVNYKYKSDGSLISSITPNPTVSTGHRDEIVTINHPAVLGYKPVAGSPANYKVKIDANQEIDVFYDSDSGQTFEYTIEHINEAGKEIAPKETGKLPVNSKLTAVEKAIPGYKYKSADPGKTIDISTTGSNKIVVTYGIDKNQLFDYEIRYYMDGSTLPALGVDTFLTDYNKATGKIVGKGYLGQDISVTIPTGAQLNNGYGPVSTNPSEVLTNGNFKTTIDKNKNIVTVNYGIDKDVKLDYKINYYLLDDKKSEVKNIDSVLTKNSANGETYAAKELTGKGHLGEKITIQQPNISGLGSEYTNYKVQTGLPTEMTLKAGVNEIDIYYVRDKNATVGYTVTYVDKGGNPIKDLAGKTQVQDIEGTGRIDSKKVVPQPKLEGYTVVSGQPTMMTIKEDPADNNEIIVYEKQSYKYEIRYLEVGSNNPIKLSPNKEEGTAEYGEKIIAANAHDDLPLGGPADYRIADSAQAKDLIVTADETKNILNIYYIPEKVDITVSFYLKGTTTKIHKDVTFEHIISGGKIGIGQEYSGTSILTAAKAIWGGNAVIPAYYKLQDGANKVKVTSSGMNISLFFRR